MQPLACEVHSKIYAYKRQQQRLAKQRKHMAVLRNDHIFMFSEVFKTLLTSSKLFQCTVAILLTLLTLCCPCQPS